MCHYLIWEVLFRIAENVLVWNESRGLGRLLGTDTTCYKGNTRLKKKTDVQAVNPNSNRASTQLEYEAQPPNFPHDSPRKEEPSTSKDTKSRKIKETECKESSLKKARNNVESSTSTVERNVELSPQSTELKCVTCQDHKRNGIKEPHKHVFRMNLHVVSCKNLEKGKTDFFHAVCGLANDVKGGTIKITNLDPQTQQPPGIDVFHQKLDDNLSDIIHCTGNDEVYSWQWKEIDTQNRELWLTVQPVRTICATDFHTKRSFPGGLKKDNALSIRKLMQSSEEEYDSNSSRSKSPCFRRFIRNTYVDNLSESERIQLKCYKDGKSDSKLKEKLENDLRKYISAFAKNRMGGNFFVGLTEVAENERKRDKDFEPGGGKMTECRGQIVEDTKAIQEYIKFLIQKRMCWLKKDGSVMNPADIKEHSYFAVTFHPVIERDGQKQVNDVYVIEIAVARFGGIAFDNEHGPEAMKINAEGSLYRLDVKDWYKELICGAFEYDGVFFCSEEDRSAVTVLTEQLKKNSKIPLLSLTKYWDLPISGKTKFQCVGLASQKCRLILVYVTKSYLGDNLKRYQTEMALIQSVTKDEGRVIPFWLDEDCKTLCQELPEFSVLEGYICSKWKLLNDYSQFDKMIEDGRERLTK